MVLPPTEQNSVSVYALSLNGKIIVNDSESTKEFGSPHKFNHILIPYWLVPNRSKNSSKFVHKLPYTQSNGQTPKHDLLGGGDGAAC